MSKQYVQLDQNAAYDQTVDLPEDAPLRDKVVAALRTIYDPEIPVNLYDLGLIYGITIDAANKVSITMTLTTPHCPVAEAMPARVECAVADISEVREVEVKLVWDPPWDRDRMSDAAKLTLGII